MGPCAARRIPPDRPARHRRRGGRNQRPARTAAPGRHHPPARGLGGDPCGADRDRGHLWHEFPPHARTRLAFRLSVRDRAYGGSVWPRLFALTAHLLAIAPHPRAPPRTAPPRTFVSPTTPPLSP